ncbi:hypothetical protein BOW53_14435 [Solemya pervernicosa gill symbiont]|uniref:Thioredoxin domain-containing protein n=2 Tax=Gammaproteobacteria incertae sedis TaxID=118884 RepID=A0A1T2L0W2_9GAMM|nr:thioredoxin family protein [Candidatus Reidiella endopervernicosa]OOZ38718.1 hypothetical protein BOW53_14435 [Solemya pervernicosa gill symbiont]QKQ25829.1 thioredoxin family protein [Candidatus Reidiella endopervernicosa]
MNLIESETELQQFVAEHPIAAIYFSSESCSVCHVLKPKVAAMLNEEFPKAALAEVDCGHSQEIAGQLSVFAVPTLILYFDGREAVRHSRSFSLGAVRGDIERPYSMFYD